MIMKIVNIIFENEGMFMGCDLLFCGPDFPFCPRSLTFESGNGGRREGKNKQIKPGYFSQSKK